MKNLQNKQITACTKINREKLDDFLLRSGTKQGYLLTIFLPSRILAGLVSITGTKNEIGSSQIREDDIECVYPQIAWLTSTKF